MVCRAGIRHGHGHIRHSHAIRYYSLIEFHVAGRRKSGLALCVFAQFFSTAPGINKPASGSQGFWQDMKSVESPVWKVSIAWILFNAAVISLFTFAPNLLTDSGFSLARAGFLTSAVMWPALVVSPAIGYLMDIVGRKRLITTLGGLVLAASILLVPSNVGWILGQMLLIGVAQTMVPAPVFALPQEVTSPARLGQSLRRPGHLSQHRHRGGAVTHMVRQRPDWLLPT